MPAASFAADARTTTVHPADPALRSALRLALLFAAIKLTLHIALNVWQAHIGWGYFRDEFYYIACGRHLAWGYVDHGPLVAVQARIAETLFGRSLAGIRLLSAVGGALRIFLTGLLTWSLGGRRSAQALAMIAVLVVPQYLGTDGYLSMNSFESLFWMSCLLALVTAQRRLDRSPSVLLPRPPTSLRDAVRSPWICFGISAGLGLLNKPSMVFFLLALGAALLLTPARRLLGNRYAAIGITLLVLIALPNLLWQAHNHWPTLEFLHNGRVEGKNIALSPLAFFHAQWDALDPTNLLVWLPGLYALLFGCLARQWRWLGLTYTLFILGMMLLHAKDYYCTPIYPILFAAGGIAWEQRFARRTAVARNRAFAFPILESALILTGILILPMAIPVLRPQAWLSYTRAMHLYGKSGNTETASSGVLPQFFADRFGWQEEVDQVTRIYNALSPADQKRVGILCSNYGEAGAINFLSHGLPPAISGHNTYFLWGPGHATGEVMIVINGASLETMRQSYDSVEIVGNMGTPYSVPFEHRNIYLARGRKANLGAQWLDLKHYI